MTRQQMLSACDADLVALEESKKSAHTATRVGTNAYLCNYLDAVKEGPAEIGRSVE